MEERIKVDPRVMCGKPVIKGTRIPVYQILDMLATGYKVKAILKEYPALEKEDITAALQYASGILKREETIEIGV